MEKNVTMTPLYEKHKAFGAQMAPFMGCLMPLHYGDPDAEHMAVRTAAGLFDAAHRCEVLLSGPDALANLQLLLCTNLRSLEVGAVRRSLMTQSMPRRMSAADHGGLPARVCCKRYEGKPHGQIR